MSYQPPSQPGESSGVSSGGYDSGGSSVPPPPPSGSYSPSPSSGYNAPPGGYGSSPGTSTAPGGGDPSNLTHLPQSYLNAVTRPSVATYEAEIPNASWLKVLIGLIPVLLTGVLAGFVVASQVSAQMLAQMDQLRAQGQPEVAIQIVDFFRRVFEFSPIMGIFSVFITFFLGAGTQYMVAKSVGRGEGSSFLTHAYLSSLSYAPLHTVGNLLGLIPVVGGCIFLAGLIYQVYCVGVSMQASHRMQGGKAQMAAFSPILIIIVLGLCSCIGLFVLGAMAGGNR